MVLSRARLVASLIAFLATFAWFLSGNPASGPSPAVLWPSVVAIGLAFLTRHIYVSLFLGAWSGAILMHQGNPLTAFLALFENHLLPALSDSWNISVLVFTLMMGGLVEVLNASGGMTSLAERVVGRGSSRRRAGLGIWILGWLLFFDGLANALLVGKTMRPAADRSGMSREKLAFIVDSTSSPIAGLALVSTWVAYELSVIQEGLESAGAATSFSALSLLVQSLPYRFYNYFVLGLVLLVVWRMRDFGPMRWAEARPPTNQSRLESPSSRPPGSSGASASMWLALTPVLVLLFGVTLGLFLQGGGWDRPLTWLSVAESFGQANAALVFVWATAIASVVAMVLSALSRTGRMNRSGPTSLEAFFEGMKQMFLPTLVLVFAWALNSVLRELQTASYLVSLLESHWPAPLTPALVFVVAALVSFGTGTSWGTMALVMPLVVPLALGLSAGDTSTDATGAVAATIGAVLAGAVFGDHCSPISDTTIVSALSSGCEVMEHVRTQLPYALAAAGLAIVLGYGPAGWNVSPWLCLVLGLAACGAILQRFGHPSSKSRNA